MMAEFCLDCLNEINETNESRYRYVLSWEKELCEGCKQYKRVVVVERLWSRTQRILAEIIENINYQRNSQ